MVVALPSGTCQPRAGAVVAAAAITLLGSPWLEAKALAQASPALVLAALVGLVA
jgi:hypothetical protein